MRDVTASVLGALVHGGLQSALRPWQWCQFAVIAAANWVGVALGPWLPVGLLDAVVAGIFTAWCLGPVILWVHGKHPRQLLWRRTERDR